MNNFEEAVSMIDERTGNANDENVFEFSHIKGEEIIDYSPNSKRLVTATLTGACGWRTKILKLAKKYPDEVQIVHTNKDKSIVCHFPADYLRINRPRELSEEEKKRRTELLKKNINK